MPHHRRRDDIHGRDIMSRQSTGRRPMRHRRAGSSSQASSEPCRACRHCWASAWCGSAS